MSTAQKVGRRTGPVNVIVPHAARLAHALDIAAQAGRYLMEHFGGRVLSTLKADGTPVSEADRGCERLIRDLLRELYPADGVLGEEHPETGAKAESRWIIDPIDGTQSFIRGVPLFGTLIAWEQRGSIELGVCAMPALDITVWATAGGGAWLSRGGGEPEPCLVSAVDRLDRAMVLTTSFDYFRSSGQEAVFDRLMRSPSQSRGWSDCYAAVMVATGQADAVYEPLVAAYDVAPFRVILPEAGGTCTARDGSEAMRSTTALYTNGLLEAAMLELIA